MLSLSHNGRHYRPITPVAQPPKSAGIVNNTLMTNMAKYAGLPWDVIPGAEPAQAYKPAPKTCLTGAELLGLKPAQVMMVAAHRSGLLAAAAQGLKTAFVPRPMEFGPDRRPDPMPNPPLGIAAADFRDLASQMGV